MGETSNIPPPSVDAAQGMPEFETHQFSMPEQVPLTVIIFAPAVQET